MHQALFRKLLREFYLQPTLRVARQLIGKYLVRHIDGLLLAGRIVEVEAYLGERDPASHAFRGKTPRNEVMFRAGGHLYVYFTYGMHYCCNVVTEKQELGRAVLLRAVEPIEGLDVMSRNRQIPLRTGRDVRNLCSGPAKLAEAFGIARAENGTDLCGESIWLAESIGDGATPQISRSTRIGITRGREHRWRFYDNASPFVSRGKPS